MRKSAVVEVPGLEKHGGPESELEKHDGTTNGHTPGGPIKTSVNADDWDIREIEEEEGEENAAKAEFEAAQKDDLEAQIEAMTAEEAEETLRQLVEFDGRLPIEVKRRNAEPATYYVRMASGSEMKVAETIYIKAFHAYRKDGIPSLSEFLQDLTEGLTEDQRERYDEISRDQSLEGFRRSQALLEFFLTETPHVGLVQMTSDVLARREQNAWLVSCCVEKFEEKDGKKIWSPVWPTPKNYNDEDSDVASSVYLDMFTTQAKLESSRFLSSSTDAAKPGSPTN